MTNKPPYYCDDYWHRLTPRQKINDLIHKIAQLENINYPEAYHRAGRILHVKKQQGETLPQAIERQGKELQVIKRLINYHHARQ